MTTDDSSTVPAADAVNPDLTEQVQKQLAGFGTELDAVQGFVVRIHRASYRTMRGRLTVQESAGPLPSPKVCEITDLLDVGGLGITDPNGSMHFFLSSFVCHPIGKLQTPVALVTTPVTDSPVYLTTKSRLLLQPDGSGDLEIQVFSWNPGGNPSPSTRFSFRVLVPGRVPESDL